MHESSLSSLLLIPNYGGSAMRRFLFFVIFALLISSLFSFAFAAGPTQPFMISQIMELQAQLRALGDKNPSLHNQIISQINALTASLKTSYPYAEMSVSSKDYFKLDNTGSPIICPGDTVKIKFVGFTSFSFYTYLSDQFDSYIGPAEKPVVESVRQDVDFVELKVLEVEKRTSVSLNFAGNFTETPPLIWQNWMVASGLTIMPKDLNSEPPAPLPNGIMGAPANPQILVGEWLTILCGVAANNDWLNVTLDPNQWDIKNVRVSPPNDGDEFFVTYHGLQKCNGFFAQISIEHSAAVLIIFDVRPKIDRPLKIHYVYGGKDKLEGDWLYEGISPTLLGAPPKVVKNGTKSTTWGKIKR